MACPVFQSLSAGLLFPRIPDTQMCANFRPSGHSWGRRGERIGMKYRVLVGLVLLAGVGAWVSCGGFGLGTPPHPRAAGAGFVFFSSPRGNKKNPITPFHNRRGHPLTPLTSLYPMPSFFF